MKSIGDWGHEYIRHLESEIVQYVYKTSTIEPTLEKLIKDIVKFNCKFHAEIQACDLLMEIDKLEILPSFIDKSIYSRICLYLQCCAKYVDDLEADKILKLVAEQYIRFKEYSKALIIAINLNNDKMVDEIFKKCIDSYVIYFNMLSYNKYDLFLQWYIKAASLHCS